MLSTQIVDCCGPVHLQNQDATDNCILSATYPSPYMTSLHTICWRRTDHFTSKQTPLAFQGAMPTSGTFTSKHKSWFMSQLEEECSSPVRERAFRARNQGILRNLVLSNPTTGRLFQPVLHTKSTHDHRHAAPLWQSTL